MADPVNQSSLVPPSSNTLPPEASQEGFSPNWQVVARVVAYVGIGTLVILAGTFLLLFPPAGAAGVVAGLGVYYGGIGVLAFGPGIFEGGGASSIPLRPNRDASDSRIQSRSGPSSGSSSSPGSSNLIHRPLSPSLSQSPSSKITHQRLNSSSSSSSGSSVPHSRSLDALYAALPEYEVDEMSPETQLALLQILAVDG